MSCLCCIKKDSVPGPSNCGDYNNVLSKNPFGDGSEIAYFKLDGNSDDEHDTYSGAAVPSGSEWISSPSGQAYRNNEKDGLWFADKQQIMDIVNYDNSYSFWFKGNQLTTNHTQVLMDMGQGGGRASSPDECSGSSIVIPSDSYDVYFKAEKNDPDNYIYEEIIFDDPNAQCWQHVCVTEDKNTQKYEIYFNGSYSLTVNYTGDDGWEDNVNGSISAHRYGDTSSPAEAQSKFKGDIDEVRIFNRVLTPQEVKRLYDGQ